MPKPKPDQVIRHEIVFGRSLQDTVDGVAATVQIRNIAEPVLNLIGDVAQFKLTLSALALLGITGVVFDYAIDGESDVLQAINQFTLQRKNALVNKLGLADTAGLGDNPLTSFDFSKLNINFGQLLG